MATRTRSVRSVTKSRRPTPPPASVPVSPEEEAKRRRLLLRAARKVLEANADIIPGVWVQVKAHPRELEGTPYTESRFKGRVVERVTNTKHKGDWWWVRDLDNLGLRVVQSGNMMVTTAPKHKKKRRKRE